MELASVEIAPDMLVEMMRTDGFSIVAAVIHDPTLEVELEVVFDAHAPLGDAWFLVSDEPGAAVEAVWLPPEPQPWMTVPVRLALIAAGVVAALAIVAALAR
jgi:hypothetical protein